VTDHFEAALRQARDAFAEGDLRQAVDLFAAAEAWAREHGTEDQADRAFCNRCAVLIELEEGREQIPGLKRVLLRSRDPMNRYLASYYTAEAYRVDEDWPRALSYARRAHDLAEELGEAAARAASANQRGTIALRSSEFSEAEAAFRAALLCCRGDGGPEQGLVSAQVTDNLGYVRMCQGDLAQGLELCEEARRAMSELGADHFLYETLQDLCYGYILDDQLERAEDCGRHALELAETYGDELIAKNCLFLLSEIAVRRGDMFGARRFLRELIAHYPEVGVSDEIVEVFLATDLTSVVNLRG
jgi:tetratricopeptide (TPR) repeat protein